MSHKATPRRTGKMRQQIARWPFKIVLKTTKKSKGAQKQEVAVHTPPAW